LPFCHVTLKTEKPLPRAYPRALCSIGDHLRQRRLELGLLQRQVSEQLDANSSSSVTNWELRRTKPALHFLPGIVHKPLTLRHGHSLRPKFR
jgi:hypothetical protein